jgi:hypothetical protein
MRGGGDASALTRRADLPDPVPEGSDGPIVRQSELVSISRSGFYRWPARETALNGEPMRLIDVRFLKMIC